MLHLIPPPTATDGPRPANRARIMQLVLDRPGIDRTRLAQATGLTNAAVTRIVQQLVAAGLVRETGTLGGRGLGRRPTGLRIDGAGGYVLGLAVTAFNASVALTDISGRAVDAGAVKPKRLHDPEATLDAIADAAEALIERNAIERQRLFGAGVAAGGYLDRSRRLLERSPHLGWPRVDLAEGFERRLGVRTVVENVNRCIAAAECGVGGHAGVRDLVLIRAALGIGGAIVSDGAILRGHDNRAGQFGHIAVAPDGRSCSCGARGCLNTVASGWAILDRLGLADVADCTAQRRESHEDRLRRVLAGDGPDAGQAEAVIAEAGHLLARHCAGILAAVDPEAVVLTGPLGRSKAYGSAFRTGLDEYGVAAGIVTAGDRDIIGPAEAASAMALGAHVYAPGFAVQSLVRDAAPSRVTGAAHA